VRGYFGIGIEAGKTPANVGGLWRSAHAFGAAFIFTVGHRYPDRYQATDTTKADRHVPLYEYADFASLRVSAPRGVRLVGVEQDTHAAELPEYTHPDRAIYLLGAEDWGISAGVLDQLDDLIQIPTQFCLNVATAGSVVLYDRLSKA
jgi:tRNA G18 (ribose-2'-O)-methylase SpoU